MTQENRRKDWQAVRSLYEQFGKVSAQCWQNAPFVEADQIVLEDSRVYDDEAPIAGEPDMPMPWKRFVLCVNSTSFFVSSDLPVGIINEKIIQRLQPACSYILIPLPDCVLVTAGSRDQEKNRAPRCCVAAPQS